MSTQTQTFSDTLKIKAVTVSIATYIISTMIAAGVLVQIWMPKDIPMERIAELAETDPFILFWSNIIGGLACMFCSILATKLSTQAGLKNALLFGALIVVYGILSILMHPQHSLEHQIVKVLSPIPLALIGGWIYMKWMYKPTDSN
jgi:peptidoglycan/LPS O-acetylase OafA/YrhL